MVSCILTESGAVMGSTVELETVAGLAAQGVVIGLDRKMNIVVLHNEELGKSKPLVRIFNTNNVKSMKVVKAPGEEEIQISTSKRDAFFDSTPTTDAGVERARKALVDAEVNVMKADISLDGQYAFLQMRKVLADTRWVGDEIQVQDIVVRAPYTSENVTVNPDAKEVQESRVEKALDRVQKILAGFTKDSKRVPLDFIAKIDNDTVKTADN